MTNPTTVHIMLTTDNVYSSLDGYDFVWLEITTDSFDELHYNSDNSQTSLIIWMF